MAQRQLAEERPQGRALVRAYTPTLEEHGWDPGHSVVEVVTDDMPFLVDSVTMELDRHEHRHPSGRPPADAGPPRHDGQAARAAAGGRHRADARRVLDALRDRPAGRPGRAQGSSRPTCSGSWTTCATPSRTSSRCGPSPCRPPRTCGQPAAARPRRGRGQPGADALAGRRALHLPRLPRIPPGGGRGGRHAAPDARHGAGHPARRQGRARTASPRSPRSCAPRPARTADADHHQGQHPRHRAPPGLPRLRRA